MSETKPTPAPGLDAKLAEIQQAIEAGERPGCVVMFWSSTVHDPALASLNGVPTFIVGQAARLSETEIELFSGASDHRRLIERATILDVRSTGDLGNISQDMIDEMLSGARDRAGSGQ